MFPVFVILVSSFIFLYNINSFPLRNWDEAWYAEITKNMASGDHSLLVPFWNSQYYFDKPPLYFWLSLPFFKFFGPGEWQVRTVSVFAAIGTSLLVYLIGKKLFNPQVGFLSFLIFITLGQVYVRFSHGNLDALLVFLFLASFYFYLMSGTKKIFSVLTGISLGLGFLTKGWSLGLFPLSVIFIYSLFKERKLPCNLGIIVVFTFLSSTWWYLLGYKEFGKPFLDWYLFTVAEGNFDQPFPSFSIGYFRYFVRDLGVWIIPVLASVFLVRKASVIDRLNIPPLIFSSFSFIFIISFTGEDLDWHILPAYPFVALLVGYLAYRLMHLYPIYPKMLFLFIIFLFIQIYVVYRIENIYPDRSRIGAMLGKYAKDILQSNEVVVLDDRDFTSFLFYSNHGRVWVIRAEGPATPRDWWIMRYGDLANFTKEKKSTVIISPDINGLPIDLEKVQIFDSYLDYKFVKLHDRISL